MPTDYGVISAACRDAGDGLTNWRISHFLFPAVTIITVGSPQDQGCVPSHMWVPIDDENTMQWSVKWNPNDPLTEEQRRGGASYNDEYLPDPSGWLGHWRPLANRRNDYLIDREKQRTRTFTGLPAFPIEDKAVTESMGPIVDRTREHLGSTDAIIIRVRRQLLDAARKLGQDGTSPPCVDEPSLYGVRSAIVNLPDETSWREATAQLLQAFSGLPAASNV